MKQLHLLLLLAFSSLAFSQVSVGAEVPGSSVITVSNDKVVFDLSGQAYPPAEFPAYYPLEESIGVRLFSNVDGNWILNAELPSGLVSVGGNTILASQIEYSLDGGDWFALGPRVVLLSGSGLSSDYETHALELRLKLVGNERPGSYQGLLNLTLARF